MRSKKNENEIAITSTTRATANAGAVKTTNGADCLIAVDLIDGKLEISVGHRIFGFEQWQDVERRVLRAVMELLNA